MKHIRITLAVVFSLPTALHAYIDPGAGSFLDQALIAGVIGILFVAKICWNRMKNARAGGKKESERKRSADYHS